MDDINVERNELYKYIQNDFNQLKNNIHNEICGRKITENQSKDICLIEHSFIRDILNKSNYFTSDYVFFSNNGEKPKIINNLSKDIKGKFGIITKNLLELLYNDYQYADEELINNGYYNYYYYKIYNNVNNSETFSYIAGYNKLLIISENSSALLILNPIDSIINHKNYVIGIIISSMKGKSYNTELYKQIILNELDLNNKNLGLKNNLIMDDSQENINDENIKKIIERIKKYKNTISFKNNIMGIFVHLYYYEKLLKLKEQPFRDYQDYYIINNDWLNKFKTSNNYDKIFNVLKKYDEKNSKDNIIDYYQLRNYQYTIFNDLSNFLTVEISDNFNINIDELSKVNEYYNDGFIIHCKIIELISGQETPKSDNLTTKYIKLYGNYIYITDKTKIKTISIGILNENLTFNTIYVIEYSSNTFSENESKKLFSMSIDEYLKLRKCNLSKKKTFDAKLYDEDSKSLYLGNIKIFGEKLKVIESSKLNNKKLINSENQNSNLDIISQLKLKEDELTKINIEKNELIKEKELLKIINADFQKELNLLKNLKAEELNDINKKYEEILGKYNILKKEKEQNEINLLNEKTNLENKNNILEKSLKEKNVENENLKTKLNEIGKDLNQINNSLNEDYKAQLIINENNLREYQNKLKEQENKYTQEINILEQKNKINDEKNKENTNIILSKENQINDLKNENTKMKNEIKNKEDELLKMEVELNNLSQNIDYFKNDIDELNKKLEEKDKQIIKINQLNKNLENINEQNNISLNKYKEELEKAKNENIENEKNLKAIESINNNDINKYQNDIIQLNSQLTEFKKKLDEKNNENEKLIKQIELKNLKIEEDKKAFEKMQFDKTSQHENYQNLEKKLKDNEEQLKHNQDLINKYESDLKTFKSQYDELNTNFQNSMKEKEGQINEIITSYENELKKMKEETKSVDSEKESANSELIKMRELNKQLLSKNNQLNNAIQIKNNEINNYKKLLDENKANKISEAEFQKILQINDELIEKNKKLEIKEKEYMNIINDLKNREKQFVNMNIQANNQINNDNEINQLEQKKNELNEEIFNLTIKLSELEQNIKNKKQELDKINVDANNNNNNFNKGNKKTKDNFPLFQFPPNIGLNNVGATCFMNSTMQCLSQTKKLTAYFLDPQNKERIMKNNIAMKTPDDLQLSPLYLELISKLWATDGSKNYSPYNFMNRVQDMNPLFQKGQAGDAKDFIIYLLEQMHSELKKNMKKNEIKLPPLNQYDQKNAIQHFFQDFQEELSIFSDVFFGFNETTNVCLNCKNNYGSKGQAFPICYNYGIFNCIIFPLEEVKNMKNKFMQMMQNNMGFNNNFNFNMNNRVNLYECFVYNEKTDKFTGENQNYCNICRKMADSDYTSRIYISPNVLILILNRGKGNMYNVKCDFALNIDITNFVILKDRPQVTYNLYGVITHIGESGPNAHFVASCKSPVNGLWYRFNDGLVYQINDFQKEVHDFWNPYILFYQKDE